MRKLLAYLSIWTCRAWGRIGARAFAALCGPAFYRFGRRSRITLPVRLTGERLISVGDDVFIGTGSWLQVLNGRGAKKEPAICIGDGCDISGYCTISAAESIVIEKSVLIARYAYISDHVHAHSDVRKPIVDQGITGVEPVRIGEGAWLGQGVVVCPGVTIGKGAVIGANSVVRHDVPDFCVAAGIPARVIRAVDQQGRVDPSQSLGLANASS